MEIFLPQKFIAIKILFVKSLKRIIQELIIKSKRSFSAILKYNITPFRLRERMRRNEYSRGLLVNASY